MHVNSTGTGLLTRATSAGWADNMISKDGQLWSPAVSPAQRAAGVPSAATTVDGVALCLHYNGKNQIGGRAELTVELCNTTSGEASQTWQLIPNAPSTGGSDAGWNTLRLFNSSDTDGEPIGCLTTGGERDSNARRAILPQVMVVAAGATHGWQYP